MSGDSVVYDGLDEAGTARAGQAPRAVSAAIEVSHLTKVFGGRTAVSDVSFSVASGEIFGFLGPNGAGKTTTVRTLGTLIAPRTLGTLIAPSSGCAIVAGMPLSAKNGPVIRSRISVMPESPGLYLRLTVWRTFSASPDSTNWTTVTGTWRPSLSTQRNAIRKPEEISKCPQR
ncbi:MAG TPA: ATP-binding cassette domain-containing protein [Streptosporangiaceae bacterium]|nr:ATP-binding cassette domain-containing protein [Streptosporangiaceae bacterium]